MTKRPTDGIRRACGIVEGMRDNEFATVEVRKAAVGEECDMLDDAVEAARQDAWDDGFEAGRERSIEDRAAAAWVRWHGGLDAMRRRLGWVIGHCSTERQLDFDFWLSGCVMHELGFEEDMADRDEVERRLLARLMPEGMEWPRFEDGEPVRIGDEVVGPDYNELISVDAVKFHANGLTLRDKSGLEKWYEGDDWFVRPSKAMDAEGSEIHVGETLYDVSTGAKRVIRAVNADGTVEFDGVESQGWYTEFLTHRAPVIAADGKPLREGEKPYRVDNGKQVEIRRIDPSNGESCVFVGVDGRSYGYWLRPGQLTHERPDSWERLEEDANKNPFDYCKDVGHRLDTCENSEAYKARDIVRRARALAERDGS